jgi:hypothetical protein
LGSKTLGRDGRVLGLNRSPRPWKRNFRRQRELREEFRPTIRNFRHGARNKNETNQIQSTKLKESRKELKEGLSLGLTRLKEDKTMISVSLSLQPCAAAAVLTPGVECLALKEL